MQGFLAYIEINQWLVPVAFLFSLGFCWVLEAQAPLIAANNQKLRHTGVNSVFLLTTLCVSAPLLALHAVVFLWHPQHQFGLLYFLDAPLWLTLLLSILVLDFLGQYGVHFLLHRIRWLWRLHMVHHADTNVDASTGFRHHPGDAIARNVASLFAVTLMGIPLSHYLVYRLITIMFAYLTHANIRVPRSLDRLLRLVFVTPDLHKFHHHFERPWTDCNYGNIFSFWDRFFRTLVDGDLDEVSYGLDVLPDKCDQDLIYQFILPFDSSIRTDERVGLFKKRRGPVDE